VTEPRVSIIVPVYDLGATLDEAVGSALGQTFAALEVIVVDDGSRDPATRALLDRARWPRATVIRAEHGGVCRARNLGLSRARGELVMFLDADDRLRPGAVEKTVAKLDAEPGLTFVSFWAQLFDGENWCWQPATCDLPSLLGECNLATCALVRRRAVEEAGGFDPAMELGHEDWDLWLRLVERGAAGAILPEILYDYRRRAGSRSSLADRGETYLEIFRVLVERHAGAYRTHAGELLERKERELRGRLNQLTVEDASEWAVARRRDEVALLGDRLTLALERALDEARRHHEVGPLARALRWLGWR
jgi:glycosyltransferase involved in cell wall biosynthesis